MCNNQQRAIYKFLANALLNKCIRLNIYRRSRLVENKNFWAANDSTCEAEELALALGKIETTFGDGAV